MLVVSDLHFSEMVENVIHCSAGHLIAFHVVHSLSALTL